LELGTAGMMADGAFALVTVEIGRSELRASESARRSLHGEFSF